MPTLGKVGPRPGWFRGAFSGRTGWLGRESGCGGGGRGGEKVLPRGLEAARVSAAGAAPLRGGSTAGAADTLSLLLAPTSYCGGRVGRGARAPSSWCRGPRVEAPGPGGGGEGAPCWPSLPLGPLPGAAAAWKLRRGSSFPPGGPPCEPRPLSPPGSPGRGLEGCATRCPDPVLLKPLLPRRAGAGGGSRARRFSPPQRLPFRGRRLALRAGGSRHGHRFQDAHEPRRGAHARRQAGRLPPPPGRRGWRRSRRLQGARAAPRPGSHPFPLALARNVGL